MPFSLRAFFLGLFLFSTAAVASDGYQSCINAWYRYDGAIGQRRIAVCMTMTEAGAACMHSYLDLDGVLNDDRIEVCRGLYDPGYPRRNYDQECVEAFRYWDGAISQARIDVCRGSTANTAQCMYDYIALDNRLTNERVYACQY